MYGGVREHQQRVLSEINARTQGRNELTRDCVVNLQAMILKLVPVPSMPQQLDMLHRNMRPELQKMVMRNQITYYRGTVVSNVQCQTRRQTEILKRTGIIGGGKAVSWPISQVGVVARPTRPGRQVHIIVDLHKGRRTKEAPAASKEGYCQPKPCWRALGKRQRGQVEATTNLPPALTSETENGSVQSSKREHAQMPTPQPSEVLDPQDNMLHLRDDNASVRLKVASITANNTVSVSAIGLADPTEEQRKEAEALVAQLIGNSLAPLGCTSWVEHAIDIGSTKPIKQKYYPVSQKLEEEMHKQVEEMLVAGIIEPSTSGWSSPVVMVRKSNGKFRFCVDFRKVNAASRPDAYPLPYMESILRKLQKARYISTLDLRSAYHQIPLNP